MTLYVLVRGNNHSRESTERQGRYAERLPYNNNHPRLEGALYMCCMHLCIQHSPAMYLTYPSFVTEKSRRWGRAGLFTPSAVANNSGNVLGRLISPQLEGPHSRLCDERQCDNKHRFALLSTRRLQYKQVKVVKVPYSGSPSPAFRETRIPFYSFRRIRPVFDPRFSSVPPFKLVRHVARWEIYRAEEKVGRRTGTAVRGQYYSWSIPPDLFSF